MKFLSIITALLPLATAKVTYEGWKIFRVETEGAYEAIEPALTDIGTLLNIDKGYSAVTVAVAPEKFGAFEALGLTTTVLTENLAADLEVETHEPYEATVKTDDLEAAALPSITYFNAYHTLAEHNQFLVDLQAAFPSNSAIYSVGNSFEGRAIQGIHLWGTGGSGSKPAIVWHGNVHAREWITGVTVEYLAYKIVEQYLAGDSTVVTALNNYDFYITPIVNPDGFVYTSTERLWRKNRQTRSGVSCVGTDINRNWPYQWTGSGSSSSACSEVYRGAAQGDTPENKALLAQLVSLNNARGVKFYLDWHSYSQLVLLPYGYSCSATAPNHSTQMAAASGVASAIRAVNGLTFTYGPTCSTIYQVNGGSLDYVSAVLGADFSWSIEMRPSSSSSNGFVIPASNIVPSGNEQWAGMKYMFTQL
ncbi:unnamed protein product [Clonostachys rhizophaga]|uniref:Carboxypeptidase M14A n=1 Tax=Clonostachys rhizophaga TaxID=160324 RepID=A0A9N9YUM0_9HYPO|nr:unnamed protein product [Clonostachys rhizophaga]